MIKWFKNLIEEMKIQDNFTETSKYPTFKTPLMKEILKECKIDKTFIRKNAFYDEVNYNVNRYFTFNDLLKCIAEKTTNIKVLEEINKHLYQHGHDICHGEAYKKIYQYNQNKMFNFYIEKGEYTNNLWEEFLDFRKIYLNLPDKYSNLLYDSFERKQEYLNNKIKFNNELLEKFLETRSSEFEKRIIKKAINSSSSLNDTLYEYLE